MSETLKRGGAVPTPSSVEDGGKVQGSGFKVQGTRLRTWQSAPANLTGFLPESGYRRQFSGGANATSRDKVKSKIVPEAEYLLKAHNGSRGCGWIFELENCGGVYSGVNRQGRSGSQRLLAHETLKRGGVLLNGNSHNQGDPSSHRNARRDSG